MIQKSKSPSVSPLTDILQRQKTKTKTNLTPHTRGCDVLRGA